MIRWMPLFAAGLAAAALTAAPAAAGPGGQDAHGAKKKVTGSQSFMEIPSLTASVVRGFETRGVLHVEAGLEIKDSKLRARAQELAPRLRAACSEALRSYAGGHYLYGQPPDADRISKDMQAAVDRTLGRTGADLILSMVIIHADR
jgi:hypothetical protein